LQLGYYDHLMVKIRRRNPLWTLAAPSWPGNPDGTFCQILTTSLGKELCRPRTNTYE
jgi:hypothetical protein